MLAAGFIQGEASGLWAADNGNPQVLVVCPQGLRAALAPWEKQRTSEGWSLRFLPPAATGSGLQGAIQAACAEYAAVDRPRFLVLVGDVGNGENGAHALPTRHINAEVNVHFGSETHIATDNPLADLDGDGVPELAVGRLSAKSPAELSAIVRKIETYERRVQGLEEADRRALARLHVVGGTGNFGPVIDQALEQWAQRLITEGVPTGYAATFTTANWRSPFHPGPHRFRQALVDRLSEGGLFWVYLGHGDVCELEGVRVAERLFPSLSTDDLREVRAPVIPPIALLLACYAGAFDARRDCLAEEMLRSPSGPVAAVAGSRVTMPYAMAVMGQEMLRQCFEIHRPTLGEVLLHAKREMALSDRRDPQAKALDQIAATLSPLPDSLAEERREHLALFNLLGDPLLSVVHPREIALQTPAEATAGETMELTCRIPCGGRCQLELVTRRDRLTFSPPPRADFEEEGDEFAVTYQAANDPRWTLRNFDCSSGVCTVKLEIPKHAHGPAHVRCVVDGPDGLALGSCDLVIRRTGKSARRGQRRSASPEPSPAGENLGLGLDRQSPR